MWFQDPPVDQLCHAISKQMHVPGQRYGQATQIKPYTVCTQGQRGIFTPDLLGNVINGVNGDNRGVARSTPLEDDYYSTGGGLWNDDLQTDD